MSKKLHFRIKGRKAYLQNLERLEAVKDFFSYSSPKARFSYAFNHFKTDDAGRPLKGKDGKWIRLWNGRDSIVKRNVVPAGLLLSQRKELEDAGYKVVIDGWINKPTISTRKGFHSTVERYDYQNKCVLALLASVSNGGGLVLSATGSGKTAIAAQFSSHVNAPIVFVVDQVNLLYQSQKEIKMWLKKNGRKDKVGIVRAKTFNPGQVTVATIQTLHAHRKHRDFLRWSKTVKIVILDEVHKQMSRRNFAVIDCFDAQMVIGLTASLQLRKKPVRLKAFSICGPVLFEFPITEGQKRGVLAKGAVLQVEIDSGRYEKYDDIIRHIPTLEAIAELVDYAIEEKDCSVIVLCQRIAHLKRLKRYLQDYNPKIVYGKVEMGKRDVIQEGFEDDRHKLMIASDVFTKGVNIKRVDVIIDCAQRGSKDDAIQKFGRGVRLHKSKSHLRYFDVCTLPAMKKAAGSRKTAFHRSKIPVKRIRFQTAEKCFSEVDKLVEKIK